MQVPARFDAADWRASARAAWSAFWPSRLAVFGVAMWVTVADLAPNEPPESAVLSHPFGAWPAKGLFDLVFSSLAKWDAQHYLAIAYDGYAEGHAGLPPVGTRTAFFPLYPGTVHILSGFGASPALVLIVAYVVSLSCFFAALVLLHRLTVIEIGERYARPALLLLAFFPTAFFFGIPYSESMFLLLAVGAFLAARTGHWAVAGVILALASATRVPGLLLIIPIVLLYLYGPRADRETASSRGLWPRYRMGPEAGWLLLAPLGLVAFSVYLHFAVGDATAWQHAQAVFGRHTVDPLTGIWAGLREAGNAFGHLVNETFHGETKDHLNIAEVGFVALAVAGGIGALRMLPVAYGTWVLVSLVPIFVSQPPDNPLWSSPRFIAVLFPIFLWLAVVCERRRVTTTVVALFAIGMAVFTAQFALWSFVA
ncbi:MAG TPA: mannosyltransferase family protein [Solirubrobacterales bacterium]